MAKAEAKMSKCKVCKQQFEAKFSSFQKTCNSVDCMVAWGQQVKDKAYKAETRVMKKASRDTDRSYWTKKVQAEFNRWIRERDKLLPCISCQRHHTGQYHAGHYKSVGSSPELRFSELNCHKQCSPCNNHLSGNIASYRGHLIAKIGICQVEWLEGPHDPAKYSMDDLKNLHDKYKKLNGEANV